MNDEAREGVPGSTEDDDLALALAAGRRALASGDVENAASAFEDALARARALADDAAEAEALGLLAQAYLRLGEAEDAARCAQAALEIARARRDEAATRHFETLLVTARSSPQEVEMSTAFGDGREALTRGEHARAVERLGRALELADEVGHRVAQGAAAHLLAQALLEVGRGPEAAALARRAEDIANGLGEADAAARARELATRAMAEAEGQGVAEAIAEAEPLASGIAADLRWGQEALADGDLERGVRHLERARETAVAQGDLVPAASAHGLLAQAYFELGRSDDAIVAASRALAIARDLRHDEAARDFETLLAVVSSGPEARELARELQLGSLAVHAGEVDRGAEHLERACELAASLGAPSELLARAMLARARRDQGREDDAARAIARCEALAAASGEAGAAAQLLELFARLGLTPVEA